MGMEQASPREAHSKLQLLNNLGDYSSSLVKRRAMKRAKKAYAQANKSLDINNNSAG